MKQQVKIYLNEWNDVVRLQPNLTVIYVGGQGA
mgnify:CR=1 FL=1